MVNIGFLEIQTEVEWSLCVYLFCDALWVYHINPWVMEGNERTNINVGSLASGRFLISNKTGGCFVWDLKLKLRNLLWLVQNHLHSFNQHFDVRYILIPQKPRFIEFAPPGVQWGSGVGWIPNNCDGLWICLPGLPWGSIKNRIPIAVGCQSGDLENLDLFGLIYYSHRFTRLVLLPTPPHVDVACILAWSQEEVTSGMLELSLLRGHDFGILWGSCKIVEDAGITDLNNYLPLWSTLD